jgi:hypothetical protein
MTRALNPLVIWIAISSVHWFKRWLGTIMTFTEDAFEEGGILWDEK